MLLIADRRTGATDEFYERSRSALTTPGQDWLRRNTPRGGPAVTEVAGLGGRALGAEGDRVVAENPELQLQKILAGIYSILNVEVPELLALKLKK